MTNKKQRASSRMLIRLTFLLIVFALILGCMGDESNAGEAETTASKTEQGSVDDSSTTTGNETNGQGGGASAEQTPLPDDGTLLRMRVRELKAILEKKGPDAQCQACTTKQEYVDRIHETYSWPDATPSASPEVPPDAPSMEELQKMFAEQNKDSEDIRKLREELKKSGINADIVGNGMGKFNAEDLAKAYKRIKLDAKENKKAKAGAQNSEMGDSSFDGSGDQEHTDL